MKKILLAIFSSAAVFAFLFFISEIALGVHLKSIIGVPAWLWGGTTDSSLGPPSLNTASGLGWVNINSDNPNTNPGASYGLNVPAGNGAVTGFGWSSNVGWVDFQPTSPFPGSDCGNASCPTWSSRKEGNKLTGWARIVSIKDAFEAVPSNSGSWQGWIKLSGPNYGVTVNDAEGKISGFAWSNELGWIRFDAKIDTGVTPPPVILPPGPPPPPAGLPPPIRPMPVLSCSGSPNPTYLTAGGLVRWTAEGGSGFYDWSFIDQDANPKNALGKTTAVRYAIAAAAKTAIVRSGGLSAECKVQVKRFNLCEVIPFIGADLCP